MVSETRSNPRKAEEAGPQQTAGSAQGSHPLEPFFKRLAELFEYANEYITVRRDKAKASVRRLLIKVVLAAFAALAGLTALIVAVILLLVGIADGLGNLVGSHELGQILVGGGLLLLAAAALAAGIYGWNVGARRSTIQRYERRHARQRAIFNSDVIERAARRHNSV